ncbi:MAG: ATP-grasp domain-containing protein [Burkholderiales bacterium]|jgi:acetyl-CoA carboxylase biotin carboxylase subunit|nr:ATP-grasp domain-containing protein [Burkholderiales bacterium]
MPIFNKVVVANRGAVAARVLRALNALGIRSLALYSDADRQAPYLALASETAHIGAAPARESYLNQERLLEVARLHHVDALHPGYGFLSENAAFAQRVEDAGMRFIGPAPRWIDAMGHKTRARELAARHGWPVGRGSDVLARDAADVLRAAEEIGYPILVKPAAGGGGIGMLPARSPAELLEVVERAASMAERGFASREVYLERLVERPRHVEVQVLGDRHGNVVHLYERDCSVQRRHQKIIEEAHAPALPRERLEPLLARIGQTLSTLGYDSLGTVEMLLAPDGEFRFLEMNTRLQVEHGVTEEITGIDLVQAQLRCAAGHRLAEVLPAQVETRGHAVQARVYAEDPKRFLPSPGTLTAFLWPTAPHVRVETGYRAGMDVTPHYDPLLAKVIAWAPTRSEAIERLQGALSEFAIAGVRHNIPALQAILQSKEFQAGDVHTGLALQVVQRQDNPATQAKGKAWQ